MKRTLPPRASYQIEARTPAQPLRGEPVYRELVSRGETQESALAAFDHYVRADAYGERRFGPASGHRLIVTQGNGPWVPGPLHPDNVADVDAARYLMPVRPRPADAVVVDELLTEVDRILTGSRDPYESYEVRRAIAAGELAVPLPEVTQ